MTARSARRPRVAAGLAVLAAAAVVGALWWGSGDDGESTASTGASTGAGATASGTATSSSPPVSVPVTMPGDDAQVATDEPVPTPASGAQVGVVVTQAGWAASGQGVEVVGFVTGVSEDGGTCRVTLTRDGQTFTAEREGLADATTTACGSIEVGDADMDPGQWQAVLSYESAGSAAASEPVQILVPTR